MPEAVIVPGLLAIDPQIWSGRGTARILRGPLAGHAELVDFSDWKSSYTFVLREAAARHGVEVAVDVLDLSHTPLVAAQLGRTILALVSEQDGDRLAKRDELVVEVSYHRGSDSGGIRVRRGDITRSMELPDAELIELVSGQANGSQRERSQDLFMPPVYDSILRAMTEDAVSLLDVDLALWCSVLPEQDLASLERELTEINARGATQQVLAEAVLAALDQATTHRVELPELGAASREHTAAFTLSEALDGYHGPDLRVPARNDWLLEDVEAYMPAERASRIERFREERSAQRTEAAEQAQENRTLMLVALGIAIVLVGVAVALGLR